MTESPSDILTSQRREPRGSFTCGKGAAAGLQSYPGSPARGPRDAVARLDLRGIFCLGAVLNSLKTFW